MLVLVNAYWKALRFVLPHAKDGNVWRLELDTSLRPSKRIRAVDGRATFEVVGREMAVFVYESGS